MEEFTKVLVHIPKDFDYKLNLRLAELKRLKIKRTKAEEIIKLAQIGLLKDKIDEMLTEYQPSK